MVGYIKQGELPSVGLTNGACSPGARRARAEEPIIKNLLNSGDLEDAFAQWAHLVEEAVSQAWLRDFGHPMPASMRGRCKLSPVQFAPEAPRMNSARHGDFEPDTPALTLGI